MISDCLQQAVALSWPTYPNIDQGVRTRTLLPWVTWVGAAIRWFISSTTRSGEASAVGSRRLDVIAGFQRSQPGIRLGAGHMQAGAQVMRPSFERSLAEGFTRPPRHLVLFESRTHQSSLSQRPAVPSF